jgi:thioredoxin-related protein
MRRSRFIPATLVAVFLLSITVGVSLGTEDKGDFLLRDYKSGFNKSLKDVLVADLNLIVLTETTCYSCIKELKAMESMKGHYKGRISVTAIFLDREGWPRVKKYLDFYQFDLDHSLVDSAQTAPERFKTNFVPSLIIFDRQGTELFRKRGFVDGEEVMLDDTVGGLLYPGKMPGESGGPASPPASSGAEGNAPVVRSSGCASAG